MGRHCDVCDVYLATDLIADQHDQGKRHLRNLANKTEREALARRSVFLFGFPAKSFANDAELADPLGRDFGAVSRVLLDSNKGTFAIVEFVEESSALKALAAKKIQIGALKVLVKERKVEFEKKAVAEVEKLVVTDVIAKLAATPIEAQVECLAKETSLREQDISDRHALATQLTEALTDYLPDGAYVQLFGSSVTGLGTQGCDLDLTVLFGAQGLVLAKAAEAGLLRSKFHLMTTDMSALCGNDKLTSEELAKLSPADRVRFLSKALNYARKAKKMPVSDQVPVLDAKCPIIRFAFNHALAVELSVDNRLAVNNSNWLTALVQSDASGNLRRFLLVLRFWALSGGLFDKFEAGKTHLNNYVLTLLAITFLQTKGKLPVIMRALTPVIINGWETDFSNVPTDFSDVQPTELLKDFFKFFAQTPFKQMVVCPRLGKLLTLDEFDASFPEERIKKNFKRSLVNVQDPFELSHNTAANISEKCLSRFRRQLVVSIAKLKVAQPNLAVLFTADDDRPTTAKSAADLTVRVPLPSSTATDAVAVTVKRLLHDVLKFEPRTEPGRKRKRMMNEDDDANSEFDVEHRLWQGRRGKRRELERTHPELTDYAAEVEVSKLLLNEEQRSSNAAGHKLLAVRVEVESAGDGAFDIHFHRLQGVDIEFHNLSHFLDTFLKKLIPQLVDDGGDDAMEQ